MENKKKELTKLIGDLRRKFDSFILDSIPIIKDENFSINDYLIFEFVGNSKRTMMEISKEVNLTPGAVSQIVDNLVKRNYLKRERDEDIDRRKVFVSLASKGKRLYELAYKERLCFSKKILDNLTEIEQKYLFIIFKKINEVSFK